MIVVVVVVEYLAWIPCEEHHPPCMSPLYQLSGGVALKIDFLLIVCIDADTHTIYIYNSFRQRNRLFTITATTTLLYKLATMHNNHCYYYYNFSLNDVVAVGKDKFYVTNYHYFKTDRMQSFELYFGLRVGNIVYFDGKNASYAAQWISTPSGMALDKSKKYNKNLQKHTPHCVLMLNHLLFL